MSINKSSKLELERQFGNKVSFDVLLAPYVAYRIGGPADALVFPRNEADLVFLSEFSKRNSIPITIIGTGTNLLVKDKGIRGVTVSLLEAFQEITILSTNTNSIKIRVGGGVQKQELLGWAVKSGYAGLEFSAGVPGTLGGGIFMNAGTKYGSYGDLLRKVRLFDFTHGASEFEPAKEQFGYRTQDLVRDSLVLWAELELSIGSSETLKAEVERIIKERKHKQPLDHPSCGSTFKNPEGGSAGRLIEKAGLKGTRVGGAEISTKHANFILNINNSTASDVLELIQIAKDEVKKQFGVELECEVIILGE